MLADDGEEVFPEAAGAADEVFPHSRLAFVDAEGDIVAAGGAEMFGGQALGVHGVAGLVEGAEERIGEIVFVVTGGDAGVAGDDAAGKGVERDVQTTR